MACCHKEYAKVCEILVCAPVPHNTGLYERLRFGILASSWLPSPVGIFLWSALHVMLLIVSGPVLWVLGLLSAFLFYSVFIFGSMVIICGTAYGACSLYTVAFDLIFLLGRSIRFCWSFVGFLACHEPIVEWRGCACVTVTLGKIFMAIIRVYFWAFVPIGVPCMGDSYYEETKNRKLIIWARWCEEVVHMHDAIAL